MFKQPKVWLMRPQNGSQFEKRNKTMGKRQKMKAARDYIVRYTIFTDWFGNLIEPSLGCKVRLCWLQESSGKSIFRKCTNICLTPRILVQAMQKENDTCTNYLKKQRTASEIFLSFMNPCNACAWWRRQHPKRWCTTHQSPLAFCRLAELYSFREWPSTMLRRSWECKGNDSSGLEKYLTTHY